MSGDSGNWTKREAAELFKFEKVNDAFEGVLIGATQPIINEKKVLQFLFARKDGKKFKINATHDMKEKISGADIGQLIRIKFVKEDLSAGKAGNPMKVFEVFVQQRPQADVDSTQITDDDIPF